MRHTFFSLFILITYSGYSQSVVSIDSSFNGNGFNIINLGGDSYKVQAGRKILVNPGDQKYIVRADNRDGVFLKYNRSGSLDSSFNGNGRFYQPNSETFEGNFYIDTQGRLINVSYTPTLNPLIRFHRTKPSGITDSTFGMNGVLMTSGGTNEWGPFVQIPNGGFMFCVLERYGTFPYDYGIALIKYRANYTVDSSFGKNGVVSMPFRFGYIYIRKLIVSPDGKIIVSVDTQQKKDYQTGHYRGFLYRFSADGNLDASFSNDGIATPVEDSTVSTVMQDCLLLSNGKMVLTCQRSTGGDRTSLIIRYHSNGLVDSSFGNFGRVEVPEVLQFNRVEAQRDGKLIFAGQGTYPLVRLTEDGARDNQFGSKGVFVPYYPGALSGFPYDLLLENDSSVLVTGNFGEDNQGNNVTTARYKIKFQPLVKGLRSKYCNNEKASGQIINMPLSSSDTVVRVTLDGVNVQVALDGTFTFPVLFTGMHVAVIEFSKGTQKWTEIVRFSSLEPGKPRIVSPDQFVCSSSPGITLNTDGPVFWRGNGISESFGEPASTVRFNPGGLTGVNYVVALRDNSSCGITSDTVLITVVEVNPLIVKNDSTLSTAFIPGALYVWRLNNTIIPGANQNFYKVVQNGSYTVHVSLGFCAKLSPDFLVNQFAPVEPPLPTPSVASLPSTVCTGNDILKLKLLNPPPAPAKIIALQNSITTLTYNASDSTFNYVISAAGNNVIQVKYSRTNEEKVAEFTIKGVATPAIGDPPSRILDALFAKATSTKYHWYLDGIEDMTVRGDRYVVSKAASYSYSYESNGCVSDRSPEIFAAPIDKNVLDTGITVMPNPVSNRLYLKGLKYSVNYEITFVNSYGFVVDSRKVVGDNLVVVEMKELPSGIYYVNIWDLNTKKVVQVLRIMVSR